MGQVTYYVVQPFLRSKHAGRIVPGSPVQVPSERAARAAVLRVGGDLAGALAFSRTGDPSNGEWEDAKVIAKGGEIPDEVVEELGLERTDDDVNGFH